MGNRLDEYYAEAKAAAKLYTEAEADLLRLKVAKKTSRYISKVIAFVITLLIGISSFIVLLMALGFALGIYFQNTALGFLFAGGVGLLLSLCALLILRKIIERSVIRKVLNELF
jgi:uncharacterized membrane protein required for colicin V production